MPPFGSGFFSTPNSKSILPTEYSSSHNDLTICVSLDRFAGIEDPHNISL